MSKFVIACCGFLLLVPATPPVHPQAYFPAGAFSAKTGADRFVAQWYTRELQVLQEKPLYPAAAGEETYRFLWLRTFHHPVSVRLVVHADGTGTLAVKMASGAGGYAPGKLVEDRTVPVTREQVAAFTGKVASLRFWDLPAHDPAASGCDGAEWVIEGVHGGKYRLVERWTPSSGPVFELGSALAFDLGGLHVPKNELY